MTYKTAIIGTGLIASTIDEDPKRKRIWSHAKAYSVCDKTELTAACNRGTESLEKFGSKWKVNLYTDYNEMLEKEDIDIVSICTPTSSHHAILKDVAKYDVKAVFCEKPLAFTSQQCRDAINICREKNIVLAVNYMRRWDSVYLKVKEIIDNKTLGDLKTIVVYSNTALYMNASHQLDLAIMLCGEINRVFGKLNTDFVREVHGQPDPGGTFHFTTANGVEGLFYADRDCKEKYQCEIDLQFSDGRLKISKDEQLDELFTYQPSKKYKGYFELEKAEFPKYEHNERLIFALENIIDVINGKADKTNCSGEDAAQSVKVIEAFYQASKTGELVSL